MLTKIGRWRIINHSENEGKWKLYDHECRPTGFVITVQKSHENNFQVSLIKEHDTTSKRPRDWAISEKNMKEADAVEIARLWMLEHQEVQEIESALRHSTEPLGLGDAGQILQEHNPGPCVIAGNITDHESLREFWKRKLIELNEYYQKKLDEK